MTRSRRTAWSILVTLAVGAALALGGADAASASVPTPTEPSGITATPKSGEVDLAWGASDAGGADVAYYVSYSPTTDPASSTYVGATTDLYWDVTGLTNGISYTFTVRPNDDLDVPDGDGPVATIVSTPGLAPTVPLDLTTLAEPGTGDTIQLFWTTPASNGGVTISDYETRYRLATDPSWTAGGIVDGAGTTIAGLTSSMLYKFEVRAINPVGDGPWSAAIDGTPYIWRPFFYDSSDAGLVGDTVPAGSTITMSGTDGWPGQMVVVTLASPSVVLGTAVVNSDGTYGGSFVIPLDATLGSNRVGASIADNEQSANIPFTVSAALPTDPGGSGTAPPAKALGTTGVDPTGPALLALLLLAAGIGLSIPRVVGRRRAR